MPILFDPSSSPADDVAAAIGGLVRVVQSEHDLMRSVEADPEETLVVFSAAADAQAAFELASAQRLGRPELGVILIRKRIDSTLLGAAMRSGIREVVREGAAQALTEACARSRSIATEVSTRNRAEATVKSERAGKVVTVFSAKGGCGKTTVATNVAAAIAQGRRRVCLVDLDLPFGDVAIMLQLDPQRSLADAVTMSGHIDEVGVRSIVTTHPGGIDVIAAPVDPADAERIAPALVTDLLTQLKSMYDVVVVDTPPAFTEQVLAALDVTDTHLLLATLDIPSVKNLKLTLEMLELLGCPSERQKLILNRSDARVGLTRADVERALRRSIFAEVPSSRDVPAAVNKAIPIVLDQPNHPVSVAMRALAGAFLDTKAEHGPAEDKQPRSLRVPRLRRAGAPA